MKRPSYVGSVEEDRPRTIYLYATSHCNSNCAYCIFRKSNRELPRIHLPLETIINTWEESEFLENCGVVVQGGEFTLHPDALGIMRYFSKNVPKLTLLTNSVDNELVYPLIDFATQVTISLDGPNHDISRGVHGNTQSIMKMLEYLYHWHKTTTLQITLGPWNAKTPEQGVANIMWFLDTCMIYDCQPRFNIASDEGLLGIANYDNKHDTLVEISTELQMLSAYQEYARIADSLQSGAKYILAAAKKRVGHMVPCWSTSIYSTIGEDGSVWMCQGLSKEQAVIGNIHNRAFDDIWRSAQSKRKEARTCQLCTLSCQLTGDLAYMKTSGRV